MIKPKILHETLIDALHYHALNSPDKPAYTFLNHTQKETLTYQALLDRVTSMASHLMRSGAPGSKALLLLQPGLDYIVSFLSCLMSGIIAVPMYPPRGNRHEKRLFSIINDAKASLVITTQAIESSFDLPNVQFICTDKEYWNLPDQSRFPLLNKENIAFLQYTSGSTGSPKGVIITHANIMANTSAIHQLLTVEHIGLCSWLPPFHDMGLIGAILYPLIYNVHSILMAPTTFLKNPFIWLKTISDYRVDISPAPNFAYEMCISVITEIEKKELDLSCWKVALNGAEPVQAKTLARFSEAFSSCGFEKNACYPAYGMAETTLMVSGKTPCSETKLLEISKSILQNQNKLSLNPLGNDRMIIVGCGYPIPDHLVKIIDPESITELPSLQIGEIIVAGPSVSQGYWDKNELNEALFGLTLSHSNHHYLRTGDLGFIDEQGELFVTGRLKDLIIIRGYNLYPQDVESIVSDSHPALIKHGCAAFILEIAGESELVVVQEIHRHAPDKEQLFDAILQQCAQELPLLPARIVLIPQITLPKTSSGKVQRKACREAFIHKELKIIAQWEAAKMGLASKPSSQQNNDLIEWMKEWLASRINIPSESINIQTNLAHYSMDSSLAIQFCGALEQYLHQEINPSLLWTYPTLIDLSQYLMLGIKKRSPDIPSQASQMEPIAIIGMSCRFPGDSSSPEAFWELLCTKKEGITDTPEDRWDKAVYLDIINKGGFIENIDTFDASLFNISRREAEAMDPQHRILLELSWEALERAGIPPLSVQESNTGVFIGIASNDYGQIMRDHLENTDAYYGIGNAHSAAAGRIAYFFGTHGESIALDTACSSSLVAIFNACQNLQDKECDLALVGGVNIILDPALYISLSKAGMLSPDGACKVFDAQANGYVRSEGAGMVVLKRLTDAKRDHNNILAVIQGMAVNSDGHSNGITAPDALAQSALIKKALHSAGITPDNISYIEAHGTGTPLGDPIEFSALKEVFATGTRQAPLYIGSVKSNIGHLEASAGIAGLIKTVLMLEHRQIPANLHFNRINPLIKLESLPAEVPTELKDWNNPLLRYAGVSSFGFTGTNAHIILSEYPTQAPIKSALPSRPVEIATLSASTLESLEHQKQRLIDFIKCHKDLNLSSLCHMLNSTRSPLPYRIALSAQNCNKLLEQLTSSDHNRENAANQPSKSAFLFTGQGSQYSGMGLELYQTHPSFQKEVDVCFNLLGEPFPISLRKVLFETQYAECLTQTRYMQPLLFIVQYALAKLWLSWGIKPDFVIGHSIGEFIAATIAGVMSLPDALKLITARGALMQEMQTGSMLAVDMDAQQAATLVEQLSIDQPQSILNIAAINSKHQVVFSGDHRACSHLKDYCKSLNLRASFLNVSHAFHSEMMTPMLSAFKKVAEEITYYPPQIKLISNLTGKVISKIDAEYWTQHILSPVLFSAGIEELATQKVQIVVEMGPQPTLSSLLYEHFPAQHPPLVLGALNKNITNWTSITACIAQLYERGFTINWEEYDKPFAITTYPFALPTYAFHRQSYWLNGENKRKVKDLNTRSIDSCYRTEWTQIMVPNRPLVPEESTSKKWLIFTTLKPSECALASQLKKKMPHALFIYPSSAEKSILTDEEAEINPLNPEHFLQVCTDYPDIQGIIYLWGMVGREMDLVSNPDYFMLLTQACSGFLHITQALIAKKRNPVFWNVTRATASIHEPIAPLMAPLGAMGKTWLLEHPDVFYQHIDVSLNEAPEHIADIVLDAISNKRDSSFIAYKQGLMYSPKLRLVNSFPDSSSKQLLQNASYLITGGLGGIGTIVIQWLLAHKVKSIVLIGRKALTPQIRAQIHSYKTSDTHISYIQADVTQYDQLEAAWKIIAQEHPPIDGIFHTAGILKDASWEQLSWKQCEQVFAAKIRGTWNLHRLSMDYVPNIRFFVLFSSISSELGSPGQANYAGANAYMDAFAHYRSQNGLPALSINWGPWDNIGMSQNLRPFWQDYGIESIDKNLGLKALNLILSKETQISFIPNQVTQKLIAPLPAAYQNILENLLPNNTYSEKDKALEGKEEVVSSIIIQKEQLPQFLLSTIRTVLHIPEKTPVSMNSSLLSLGMDSISAAELVRSIQKHLGIHTLTIQTLLFENYSLEKIIAMVEAQWNEQEQPELKTQDMVPAFMFLAPAQMAIWKYIHAQPFNNAYIVSGFFTLEGPVNPQFFEQSIQSVLEHHPVLHSSFHEVLGNPMQHQESSLCFRLQFDNLRLLPKAQRDKQIAQREYELTHYQFNLSKAPLITSYLIQCAEQQFVWGIAFSRLMADAHSTIIIYRDILHYYLQYQSGVGVKHQKSGSYYSYVHQQMEAMVNGVYEQSIAFWQKELSTYSPNRLFRNTSGDKITKAKGLKQTFCIPEEDYILLLDVSKAIEVTPANILFSVYALSLIEHFNRSEAFVSILCSGRNGMEYQETVGDFSSEIHLCLKYHQGAHFKEFAKQAQLRITSLLPYQNIQPEQLTELGLSLPQVSFDFQSLSLDIESLPFKLIPRSIQSEDIPLWGTNPRALSLKLSHMNNQISGYFKYRSDLLDSKTITHLSRRFLKLLHKVLQDPESIGW